MKACERFLQNGSNRTNLTCRLPAIAMNGATFRPSKVVKKHSISERIGSVLDLTDLSMEPLVYIQEEFQEPRASPNPFIEEIPRTGIEL
ncbi:MAG: hypothetical protein N2Z84_05450 [Atribacterota bacterium]|nr:hypothetical protein [Atribacterota bacterium]